MGKKKRSKRKIQEVIEASAATGVVSSSVSVGGLAITDSDEQQQLSEVPPRRKRGRPRKIVENIQQLEEKEQDNEKSKMEKPSSEGEDEGKKKQIGSSSNMGVVDGGDEELKAKEETVKSRGRRKGQPRKSSTS